MQVWHSRRWLWSLPAAALIAAAVWGVGRVSVGGTQAASVKLVPSEPPSRGAPRGMAAVARGFGFPIESADNSLLTRSATVPGIRIPVHALTAAEKARLKVDGWWPAGIPANGALFLPASSADYASARSWVGARPHDLSAAEPLPGWKGLDQMVWDGQRLAITGSKAPHSVRKIRLNLALSRSLSAALEPGDHLLAADGRGRILALDLPLPADFPKAAPLAVGEGFLPPMLALALEHPGWFPQSSPTAQGLEVLAKRWGSPGIVQGFAQLGLGTQPMAGATSLVPPAPTGQTGTLTTGAGVRATLPQLVRAYLPLVNGGHLPQLTLATTAPVPGGKTIMTSATISTVAKAVPHLTAGGVTFEVWRPLPDLAVAWTSSDGGCVLAVKGSGVQELPSILTKLAHAISAS